MKARRSRGAREFELPFERWGQEGAPALLLLHGFTGNRSSWRHLEPWLGSRVRAIASVTGSTRCAPFPASTKRMRPP